MTVFRCRRRNTVIRSAAKDLTLASHKDPSVSDLSVRSFASLRTPG